MELVQVNEGFPYYGGLVFKDKTTYPQDLQILKENEVWVYQEVLDLLELKINDTLKIGNKEYIIKK